MSSLDDGDNWVHYKVTIDRKINKLRPIFAEVVVQFIREKLSLETLMGFNNTGNVCVWLAEEVMAFYCLKHLEMFEGASICELGGGMTSLAGLLLATTHVPSNVLVTDGNQKSVDNVKDIITANLSLADVDVSAEVLLWGQSFLSKPSTHDSTFDFVLCADCLFFTSVHYELVQVIYKLLKPNGEALIFAPRRSGTLEQFCSVAKESFELCSVTKYDDVIWLRHEEALHHDSGHYKEDIHYPIMISLKRR
jgi:calmodulin-lysine N-methyltransferase